MSTYKWSICPGGVFPRRCLSRGVSTQGLCLPRGLSTQGSGCLARGMYTYRPKGRHPRMTIKVRSMYPTGMHCCLVLTMIFPYVDLRKKDTNWMFLPSLTQIIIMKVFLIVPRHWQVVKVRKLDLSTSRYKMSFAHDR